jgi:hypothetical protein
LKAVENIQNVLNPLDIADKMKVLRVVEALNAPTPMQYPMPPPIPQGVHK